MLLANGKGLPSETPSFVSRIKNFVNHLQRSTHLEPEFHNEHQDILEDAFNCGQDEERYPSFAHLPTRPASLFQTAPMIRIEGTTWKEKYTKHSQLMFSSFQHHWHNKGNEGHRQPLPYCRAKRANTKSKKECKCRMGFPKKVHPLFSSRPRVVCKGIAALLDLPLTGRRDMSGSIAPTRENKYCSGTSAV